jgi:uncharacterized phage protein (TIGR02220 family)
MAEDWIKMRTDLYRDPKVCVIADALMEEDGELARFVDHNLQRKMSVTRNVMRNVTVGALVSVWGVMRLRGKPDNNDLVCRGVSISVIDDIADLPGFGAAMASVGWVLEVEEGLVFPHFFEDHNVDPDAKAKTKAAERQKKFRERQKEKADSDDLLGDVTRNEYGNVTSNVTHNVTVTSRNATEKRREEKSKEHISSDAQSVLEHLNAKANRAFQATPANAKLIVARMREGATVDQLKAVVDAKVAEWSHDPKMSQYLRPATLFNAEKFGQYSGSLRPPGEAVNGSHAESVDPVQAAWMRGAI